jgi:hypothetical protein
MEGQNAVRNAKNSLSCSKLRIKASISSEKNRKRSQIGVVAMYLFMSGENAQINSVA